MNQGGTTGDVWFEIEYLSGSPPRREYLYRGLVRCEGLRPSDVGEPPTSFLLLQLLPAVAPAVGEHPGGPPTQRLPQRAGAARRRRRLHVDGVVSAPSVRRSGVAG